MVVDVYNSRSAAARSVFARIDKDDILEVQMRCTAVVDVPNDAGDGWAFFDEERRPGRVGVPYMVVLGSVSELFIEDDDPRLFPCGAKRLRIRDFNLSGEPTDEDDIKSAIPVRVNWQLTSQEIGYLYQVGMKYDGFTPPTMLKGNQLEIPVNIVYKACYESPICAVDIIEPFKLNTSTKYNRYDTMFMNCQQHPGVQMEMQNGGVDIEFNVANEKNYGKDDVPFVEDLIMADDVSDNIEISDDNLVIDHLADEPVHIPSPEEIADEELKVNIEQKMQIVSDQISDRMANPQPVDISSVVNEIREEANKPADDFDSFSISPNKTASKGSVYLSDKINELKAKTSGMAGDADSQAGLDNEFIPTDELFAANATDSKESSAERAHKRAERYTASRIEQINRVDRALDNIAINSGITDTAGFGAAAPEPDKNKPSAAQGLLARVTGKKPAIPDTPEQPKAPENQGQFL